MKHFRTILLLFAIAFALQTPCDGFAQDRHITRPGTTTTPRQNNTRPRQNNNRQRQNQRNRLQHGSTITSTDQVSTQIITVNDVSFTMVFVQGGTFIMGTNEKAVGADHTPHKVTLSDFYIGQTEVTQALWVAVMGNNPSYFKGNNRPVEQVTWEDCQNFIATLNRLTGRNFHLPTEAQWEYAARGGNRSRGYRYSGSNNLDEVAWYWRNSGDSYLSLDYYHYGFDYVQSYGYTHNVALKKSNELGIYDMTGNVDELCQDNSPYNKGSQINPVGLHYSNMNRLRGQSYRSSEEYLPVWQRNFGDNVRRMDGGLRLAL